ncbi:MAG: LamG-like jellyroll fold domain-containing protein [Verrucomicrobiota bacterium]
MVQLELFSGVTLVIEGESVFEIHSAMEMSVHSGKLRAIVPKPARGFRVRTASGELVDLGTEFAIDVTEQHADLHVLNGEIEWHPNSKPMTRLVDGESIRWDAERGLRQIAAGGENFAGINDLEGHKSARRDAWAAHSQQLREDPRLLVYYPMDQSENWNRQLLDESGAEQNGVIVRAQRVSDRWGQSYRALDFSPTGSRVRLSVPGEHSALTLYCWVRIDSLDRWYNSLFLTDGHELQEPHWQIMDDGRLFFSVKKQEGGKGRTDKHIAYSPPIWNSSLSGQWMQIASVYDSSAKTTTHYVNGEQISQDRLPDSMVVEKVRIGAASIGNWSEPMRQDPHFAVRNLNGAIDEFAIFSSALSAEEIRELYEIGKP